jgi:hypothetical protein
MFRFGSKADIARVQHDVRFAFERNQTATLIRADSPEGRKRLLKHKTDQERAKRRDERTAEHAERRDERIAERAKRRDERNAERAKRRDRTPIES